MSASFISLSLSLSLSPTVIHLLDATSGKPLGEPLKMQTDAVWVSLNQSGLVSDRKLLVIDSNRDLFMTPVIKQDLVKLSTVRTEGGGEGVGGGWRRQRR